MLRAPFSGLAALAPLGARYARPSGSLRSPVWLPSPLRLLRPASAFPPVAPTWASRVRPSGRGTPTHPPSPPRHPWGLSLLAPSGRCRVGGLLPSRPLCSIIALSVGVCCACRRLICLVAVLFPAVVALWSCWRSFGPPCRSRPASALPLSGSWARCAAGPAIAPSFLGESGSGLRPRFLSAPALSLRPGVQGVSPRPQPGSVCHPAPRVECPPLVDLLRGLLPPAPPSPGAIGGTAPVNPRPRSARGGAVFFIVWPADSRRIRPRSASF